MMGHILDKTIVAILLVSLMMVSCPPSQAIGLDQMDRNTFLRRVFPEHLPSPNDLWVSAELRSEIEGILKHKYRKFRVRYWSREQKTVWILDDIVKKEPISVAVVVYQARIEALEILMSSGKHAQDIRNDYFTKQFWGTALDRRKGLSKDIDGISGATLSTRAVSRMARMALLLDGATP